MDSQERNELFICRFIREPPLAMYDMGVGGKSEWRTLPARYPQMKVFGCEPNPVQYARLLKARFPGPLVEVAIGEPEGTATLHVPRRVLTCSSLFPVPMADSTCTVDVWSLDRFDAQMGRPDRILLWMDVEGSEVSAARSGSRLLESGRVRWINVEERCNGHCPAEGWCRPEDLQRLLTSHGYLRVAEYSCSSTHLDAVYVHKDERPTFV